MSKKTSPSAARRPRTSRTGGDSRPGRVLHKGGATKAAVDNTPKEPTFASRMRSYLPVALLPNGIVVGLVIVFALVALISTSSPMAAMPSVIAQAWLVFNLVPVTGVDLSIGLLPAVPAIGLIWAVSARVYRAVKDRVSIADLVVLALCVLGIPILLTLTACAMLFDASVVYPVAPPNIGIAVAHTALVHAIAMVWGMRPRLWKALARRFSVPEWFVDSAALAVVYLRNLLLASLVVYLISLAVHFRAVGESVHGFTGAGILGLSVLTLLYLPNLAVGTMSVTSGSLVALGPGELSLFGVNLVPLPPIPALAAVPQSTSEFAIAALVVPVGVAVFSIYKNVPAFKDALVATAFVALFTLVLCYLAGGELGVYGYMGPAVWLSTALVTAWFAIVSILAACVLALMNRAPRGSEVEDYEEPHEEEPHEEEPVDTVEPEEQEEPAEAEGPEEAEEPEQDDQGEVNVDKQEAEQEEELDDADEAEVDVEKQEEDPVEPEDVEEQEVNEAEPDQRG